MSRKPADFTYLDQGMFIAILPNSNRKDVTDAWNELAAETDGTGKVLRHQFLATRAALKRAGYTVAKAPKPKACDLDAILKELGML